MQKRRDIRLKDQSDPGLCPSKNNVDLYEGNKSASVPWKLRNKGDAFLF